MKGTQTLWLPYYNDPTSFIEVKFFVSRYQPLLLLIARISKWSARESKEISKNLRCRLETVLLYACTTPCLHHNSASRSQHVTQMFAQAFCWDTTQLAHSTTEQGTYFTKGDRHTIEIEQSMFAALRCIVHTSTFASHRRDIIKWIVHLDPDSSTAMCYSYKCVLD